MYNVPSDPKLPVRSCAIVVLVLLFLICYGLSLSKLIRYELGENVAKVVTVLVVVLTFGALLWLARQLKRNP